MRLHVYHSTAYTAVILEPVLIFLFDRNFDMISHQNTSKVQEIYIFCSEQCGNRDCQTCAWGPLCRHTILTMCENPRYILLY